MDFWNQHSVLFVIGLVLWPRMLLIYFGMIPQMSIPPLLGMVFVPRMFLAGVLTPMYWDTNPALMVVCWILAVVIDILGISFKLKAIADFQKNMQSVNS